MVVFVVGEVDFFLVKMLEVIVFMVIMFILYSYLWFAE